MSTSTQTAPVPFLDRSSSSEAALATGERPSRARTLTPEESLCRLPTHAEGRLHHMTGVGPRALIVEYSYNEDGLWIRLPDFVGALHSAPSHHVTLEATGVSRDNTGWVVFVTGGAARVTAPVDGAQWRDGWPADLWSGWLFVPATSVQGFSYPLHDSEDASL